jgi:uncharacterized protein YjiK
VSRGWVALAALGLAAMIGGAAAALRIDGEGRGGRGTPGTGDVLGQPETLSDVGVREPSGVAYHPRLQRLYVVGDEGSLAVLDDRGAHVRTLPAPVQVEDVVVLPDGSLLLVRERGGELLVVDAEAGREKRRWQLDSAGLVGGGGSRTNEGFEGLAFRPDAQRPGAGVLYLVHQRAPAMIVAARFDPQAEGDRLGSEAVVSRWSFPNEGDLTAAAYVPSLGRILVIADARDRLLVVDLDGKVQASLPLPGAQQEGLAIDDAGTLWIADDRAGRLLRFPGALARIAAAVGAHSTGP